MTECRPRCAAAFGRRFVPMTDGKRWRPRLSSAAPGLGPFYRQARPGVARGSSHARGLWLRGDTDGAARPPSISERAFFGGKLLIQSVCFTPKSGREASPLKESALCQKRTFADNKVDSQQDSVLSATTCARAGRLPFGLCRTTDRGKSPPPSAAITPPRR